MMNVAKGNMYAFVTHTKNYIKGKCPHDCEYCYMKVFDLKPIRFDKKELDEDMGEDKFIFVGSSCDMFASGIPAEWIHQSLVHCNDYTENRYLFQSKNPARFLDFMGEYTDQVVFGTTIETNRVYKQMGGTPDPESRAINMSYLSENSFETMVTIEPIIDFDLQELVDMIQSIHPTWVNIGADSKGHALPEPDKNKITELINELKNITDVKLKDNLKRLIRRCINENN